MDDRDSLICTPEAGELQRCHYTALALTREKEGREQRIMVLGDSDCFSNLEMTIQRKKRPAYNPLFFTGVFHWLSNGVNPVDVRREGPVDNDISLSVDGAHIWTWILKIVFPLLLATIGCFIVIRRSRR